MDIRTAGSRRRIREAGHHDGQHHPRRRTGVLMAPAAALVALAAPLGQAQAQETVEIDPCPPGGTLVSFTESEASLPHTWAVEGSITEFSDVDRTLTVNGMTFTVPEDVSIAVDEAAVDADSFVTFEEFIDPAAEALRSITGVPGSIKNKEGDHGATIIADGDTEFTPAEGGSCMTRVATSVFSEFAENAVIGVLTGVDVATETFFVNGAPTQVNADPRYPANFVDEAGGPITAADLQAALDGADGYVVPDGPINLNVLGYYAMVQPEAFADEPPLLYGTEIVAGFLKLRDGIDTVSIRRALVSDGELKKLDGEVSKLPSTGEFAESVTLHAGSVENGACGGPELQGRSSVTEGAFQFSKVPTDAGSVCVQSSGGGASHSPVCDTDSDVCAPAEPTNVSATAGDATATVAWAQPFSDGGASIDQYTVTIDPADGTCTVDRTASTATCTSLTNDTDYTLRVAAANDVGIGPAAESEPVTPTGPDPVLEPASDDSASGDDPASDPASGNLFVMAAIAVGAVGLAWVGVWALRRQRSSRARGA